MQVICIDARNRPKTFPKELWLVERVEVYTVVDVLNIILQPGVFGYVLKERDLSSVQGYDSFDSRRFRLATEEDLESLKEAESLVEELSLDLVS